MESETEPSFRDEFFMAFGEFNYIFALIEELMKQFINAFIDNRHSKVGGCITADMPFNPLYHALMSLCRLKEPTMVEKLESALNAIDTLEKTRNKHIHAVWKIDPDTKTITRLKNTAKFGIGFNPDRKEYTLSTIRIDIDELITQGIVLNALLEKWTTENSPKEQT
jgi:hypothetical protein